MAEQSLQYLHRCMKPERVIGIVYEFSYLQIDSPLETGNGNYPRSRSTTAVHMYVHVKVYSVHCPYLVCDI